jgi:FlaA1/EpsC-like NDP-sugar epimerase
MTLNPQLKNPHFYFMVLCDVLIFVIALIGAHLLRFELSLVAFKWVEKVKFLLLWVVPLKSLIFFYFDLYRGMWRYTGLADMWQLVRACFLSSLLILAVILYVSRFEGYSRSVFVIDGVLTFILTGGLRFGIRNYYLRGKTFWLSELAMPVKSFCGSF